MKRPSHYEKMVVLLCAFFLLFGCSARAVQPDREALPAGGDVQIYHPEKADSRKELCLEFHGSIISAGENAPIDLFYYQTGQNQFHCELNIGKQQMIIPLREDFMVGTVDEGFKICDVNQDGSDDLLIDHGIFGRIKIASCYVYTADGFMAIPGFEDLSTPQWSESGKVVFEQGHAGADYFVNRYQIQRTQLILMESLLCRYNVSPDGGTRCTVSKRIDDKMVVVQENVPDSNINMEYWYH